MDENVDAGVGIFFAIRAVGSNSTSFDREIEATCVALKQIVAWRQIFNKVVDCSVSRAALQTISVNKVWNSKYIHTCWLLLNSMAGAIALQCSLSVRLKEMRRLTS